MTSELLEDLPLDIFFDLLAENPLMQVQIRREGVIVCPFIRCDILAVTSVEKYVAEIVSITSQISDENKEGTEGINVNPNHFPVGFIPKIGDICILKNADISHMDEYIVVEIPTVSRMASFSFMDFVELNVRKLGGIKQPDITSDDSQRLRLGGRRFNSSTG